MTASILKPLKWFKYYTSLNNPWINPGVIDMSRIQETVLTVLFENQFPPSAVALSTIYEERIIMECIDTVNALQRRTTPASPRLPFLNMEGRGYSSLRGVRQLTATEISAFQGMI